MRKMEETPSSNNPDSIELSQILNYLKKKGNFSGIILTNRNGEIIDECLEKNIDRKLFSSMCASVLESAVGLGETMGNQRVVKIIAELEETSVIIVEIKEKMSFLILILNDQSEINFFLKELDFVFGLPFSK